MKIILTKILLFATFSLSSLHSFAQPAIIFDTDFGSDADDLGALAILNHFVNKGECNLLAVMVWSTEKYAVPAVDAVNTFYGNPDIPIGVRKDDKFFENWNYSKSIADAFAHDETYESATESTVLYRRILSESKDKDIKIITVGPLQNIDNLLNSPPDSISPLSGKELLALKVKEMVIMGGQFPEGEKEWNFDGNMPGVTKRVIENLKVPIVFSGYELGVKIRTAQVFNKLDENHPLYVGYIHFSEHSPWMKDKFEGKILPNATFDQTAVLYAIKGGVGTYWDKIENGMVVPDEVGGNTWIKKEHSNHSYLKLKMSEDELAKLIDSMMLGD